MTPFVDDSDFTLFVGDVRDVLATMPDESVHCVVTSPPYWSLRDYGMDGQLGLEPTVEEYVANLVGVFSGVRRVLRRDGTLWCNLGDSFGDKQMAGVPWKVAFALQADGWYLRSDIIWSKPNPMPESVTDRPTKAHEYLFLLTRSPRYFWDADGIREPAEYGYRPTKNGSIYDRVGSSTSAPEKTPGVITHGGDPSTGRNRRSVWVIATEPYPDAHFATFPQALVEPCVLAGTSERGCCPVCGAPWERETEIIDKGRGIRGYSPSDDRHPRDTQRSGPGSGALSIQTRTTGWRPTCDHDHQPVPCTVLDPFMGSGTTAVVARRLGRKSIGIELNHEYAQLAATRLQQLSLLA